MLTGEEQFAGYALNPMMEETGQQLRHISSVNEEQYLARAQYAVQNIQFGTVQTKGFSGVLPDVYMIVDGTLLNVEAPDGSRYEILQPYGKGDDAVNMPVDERDKTTTIHYVLDEAELVMAINAGFYADPEKFVQQVNKSMKSMPFSTNMWVQEEVFSTFDNEDQLSSLRLIREVDGLVQTDREHSEKELASDLGECVRGGIQLLALDRANSVEVTPEVEQKEDVGLEINDAMSFEQENIAVESKPTFNEIQNVVVENPMALDDVRERGSDIVAEEEVEKDVNLLSERTSVQMRTPNLTDVYRDKEKVDMMKTVADLRRDEALELEREHRREQELEQNMEEVEDDFNRTTVKKTKKKARNRTKDDGLSL